MNRSAAVARRRVRLAVREAREALGLTQGQVAEAMEWSLSKVIRIESGEVGISVNDLRTLLTYLDIRDRERVDELVESARVARRRKQWWDEPELREYVTPASRQLIQYESEAIAVRHFYTVVFPGRLQTEAYAKAVLESFSEELPDEVLRVRLSIRLRRRQELLARPEPPQILLLLDESVLYRQVGDLAVVADQFAELLRLQAAGRLLVRVMPLVTDAPPAMLGNYEILDLPGEENALMYREGHIVDEIVEDRSKIDRYRTAFERYWKAALEPEESARLIENRIQQLTA